METFELLVSQLQEGTAWHIWCFSVVVRDTSSDVPQVPSLCACLSWKGLVFSVLHLAVQGRAFSPLSCTSSSSSLPIVSQESVCLSPFQVPSPSLGQSTESCQHISVSGSSFPTLCFFLPLPLFGFYWHSRAFRRSSNFNCPVQPPFSFSFMTKRSHCSQECFRARNDSI